MRDVARRDSSRLHVPQFLDADSVALRIQVVEFFLLDKFFGKRTARALGQHRDFCAQLVARDVVVFRLAVLVEAFVFGDDSGDAIALVNKFGSAEFFEHVDARGFDQTSEPLGQFAQRHNIVALVLERRRRDGKAEGRSLREKQRRVIRHRCIQRRALLEFRHQLRESLRIHDRAGKLVRPDLAPLFQHVDVFSGKLRPTFARAAGFVVLLDETRQMHRARKPRRPRANDEDIGFELFTLDGHVVIRF